MGFRLRHTFSVLPGVRLTLTHRGLSVSVGPRAAKLSASTNGRVTRTFSIPGTGLSHIKTLRNGSRRGRSLLGTILRRG
ncbi:MAG TPA: DUF4236 domain-containing protein [Propionibacteriaceae bacterium]